MPKVQKVEPAKLGRKIFLSCGHTSLRNHDNVTLQIGSEMVCESCLRHEQAVVSISVVKGTDKFATKLSCGHQYTTTLHVPIIGKDTGETASNLTEFLGTSNRCIICEAEERV